MGGRASVDGSLNRRNETGRLTEREVEIYVGVRKRTEEILDEARPSVRLSQVEKIEPAIVGFSSEQKAAAEVEPDEETREHNRSFLERYAAKLDALDSPPRW